MATWGTINPRMRNRSAQLSDLVDVVEFQDGGNYKRLRAIGPVVSYAAHWFTAISQAGKDYQTMRICLNYDPATENFNPAGHCPYCAAEPDDEPSVYYISNFIDRQLEENEPINKARPQPEEMQVGNIGPAGPDAFPCYLKTKGSPTWTPVRVFRATGSHATKLKNFQQLNTRTNSQTGQRMTFPINHLRYGMDISVKYDGNQAMALRYDFQRDAPTAISDKERKFHFWRLDIMKPASVEAASKDWNWLKSKLKVAVSGAIDPNDPNNPSYGGDDYYGGSGYDDSDLEAPITANLNGGYPPGTIGLARVRGEVYRARIDEVSYDGSQYKITLQNGSSGIISSTEFRTA